jgi:hypothetical protein
LAELMQRMAMAWRWHALISASWIFLASAFMSLAFAPLGAGLVQRELRRGDRSLRRTPMSGRA